MKQTMEHLQNLQKVMLAVAAAATLSGCASSLVGYSAETSHTCSRDQGVGCTPVSDVYKMAMAGKLPGQASARNETDALVANASAPNLASAALRPAMSSGMPVRTAPRVLRVWYAPWRDGLDVLHDQRHSYLTLDTGRWLIEHNQERLMREFGPTRLLQGATPESAGSQQIASPQRQNRTGTGASTGMPPLPLQQTQPGVR
jgi:conjugal transfer pilus assembly protein TraV